MRFEEKWSNFSIRQIKNELFVPLDSPQIFTAASGEPQIFGPEIGLARQLYTDGVGPISIIKVAFPDTSLAVNWLGSGNNLTDQLVTFANRELADQAKVGVLGVVGALYWYQGESDAMSATLSAAYQLNLVDFISEVRQQIPFAEGAPVILVKESLAETLSLEQAAGTCPEPDCATAASWDEAVRSADDWAVTNLVNVAEVDSIGLPRLNVFVHLTNVGELAIGHMMAQVSEPYLFSLEGKAATSAARREKRDFAGHSS